MLSYENVLKSYRPELQRVPSVLQEKVGTSSRRQDIREDRFVRITDRRRVDRTGARNEIHRTKVRYRVRYRPPGEP